MNLAADDGERLGKDRPWTPFIKDDSAWGEYAAWQEWLDRACATMVMGPGFDPSCPREGLDRDAEIALYVVMSKLADGEPVAVPAPSEAHP